VILLENVVATLAVARFFGIGHEEMPIWVK